MDLWVGCIYGLYGFMGWILSLFISGFVGLWVGCIYGLYGIMGLWAGWIFEFEFIDL
jgi:hypothetical protein